MTLSDWLVSTAVFEGGSTLGKAAIIQQLLQRLSADGHVAAEDLPALQEAVMQRESLGTTGIGQGVALPHCRTAAVTRSHGMVAVYRPPVEFESLDGEPADILILCLSPHETPGRNDRADRLRAEQLMRLLRENAFRDRLRQVASADEITQLFRNPSGELD